MGIRIGGCKSPVAVVNLDVVKEVIDCYQGLKGEEACIRKRNSSGKKYIAHFLCCSLYWLIYSLLSSLNGQRRVYLNPGQQKVQSKMWVNFKQQKKLQDNEMMGYPFPAVLNDQSFSCEPHFSVLRTH